MRILKIKLENFTSVLAAMGKESVEFDFSNINKPIIQIYGANRCGKTVLLQQLHPFSNINLNGDERSDLSLIIPKKVGVKNIIYEVDGKVYDITHVYQPTKSSHSVSSSIVLNGEELNPSGGVTVFNNLVEKIFGINKYIFQFIINGTQLTSFANMTINQRKNLLNKAMGIDIYDKIHKMATDDFRYTNKLIGSLSNSKEYIISNYGSEEALCMLLKKLKDDYERVEKETTDMRSRLDSLSGEIKVLHSQNIYSELMKVEQEINNYKQTTDMLGDNNVSYNELVNEQISIANSISTLRNEKLLYQKDIDNLYDKKTNIENTLRVNQRNQNDYNNLISIRDELKSKINLYETNIVVNSTSSYLNSKMTIAQTINEICTEIVTCLNHNHLILFKQMIENRIDIASFILNEGSVLNDSELERSVVSRIKNMVNAMNGDFPDKCEYDNCIYKNIYKLLDGYFKSYESTSNSEFTQYDLDQFEHAFKNLMTIKKLLNDEYTKDIESLFDINNIMDNLCNNKIGIDVGYIEKLMEVALKNEQRTQFIIQLNNVEKSIETIKSTLIESSDSINAINELDEKINECRTKINDLEVKINNLVNVQQTNDNKRMLLSRIQHVNIAELTVQYSKLSELMNKLQTSENEFNSIQSMYNEAVTEKNALSGRLKTVSEVYNQFRSNEAEINSYTDSNKLYKIISEATSSTKGKPVIAIKETVEHAMKMTNRLLDIMYDGDIELLEPIINETAFDLPFRSGSHTSYDIRYGSQSESTLLSLALELSIVSSLTSFNIPLIDEIDAYIDSQMHSSFVLMLEAMMNVLKMDQMFLISHNLEPDQYDHIVHTINLSKQ